MLTLPPSATKAPSVSASSWFLAVAALCLRITLQNSGKSISPELSWSTCEQQQQATPSGCSHAPNSTGDAVGHAAGSRASAEVLAAILMAVADLMHDGKELLVCWGVPHAGQCCLELLRGDGARTWNTQTMVRVRRMLVGNIHAMSSQQNEEGFGLAWHQRHTASSQQQHNSSTAAQQQPAHHPCQTGQRPSCTAGFLPH